MTDAPVPVQGNGAPPTLGHAREVEWQRRFAALTLAWLTFETASGLAIWLVPFSVPAQWTVVVHTGIGALLLLPILVYLWQHLVVYWNRPGSAVKWMGYLGTAATLVAVVSGLVLTAEALWGTRISYAWDRVHLVSTFALLAFALPHVAVTLLRDRAAALKLELPALRAAPTRALRRAAAGAVLMAVPVAVLWAVYPGDPLHNVFPPDYSHPYGPDRPLPAAPTTPARSPAPSPAGRWAATSRSRPSGG